MHQHNYRRFVVLPIQSYLNTVANYLEKNIGSQWLRSSIQIPHHCFVVTKFGSHLSLCKLRIFAWPIINRPILIFFIINYIFKPWAVDILVQYQILITNKKIQESITHRNTNNNFMRKTVNYLRLGFIRLFHRTIHRQLLTNC